MKKKEKVIELMPRLIELPNRRFTYTEAIIALILACNLYIDVDSIGTRLVDFFSGVGLGCEAPPQQPPAEPPSPRSMLMARSFENEAARKPRESSRSRLMLTSIRRVYELINKPIVGLLMRCVGVMG